MADYEVQVSNSFEADTPEDAVEQMAHWLNECAYTAGYRVFKLDSATFERQGSGEFIDAENILFGWSSDDDA